MKKILSLQHPYTTVSKLFTFLWFLWKARNDYLFARKEGQPYQVAIAANALLHDLEVSHNSGSALLSLAPGGSTLKSGPLDLQPSGVSITTDLHFAGSKIFVDAAWKASSRNPTPSAGLGVYFHWQDNGWNMDVFLQARATKVASLIIEEAKGLLLAARMASHITLQNAIFFTDNQTLAKAAASSSTHPLGNPSSGRTVSMPCRSSSLKNPSYLKRSQWRSSQL